MPDTIPGTDSPEVTTTPQGTETPANDQPGATGDGAGATAPQTNGFDEDFLKRLDTDWSKVDPTTLPQKFNEQFVPKPVFTRKTQEFAEKERALQEREKAIFDVTRRVLAERDAQRGPTAVEQKVARLKELADSGDADAQQQLLDFKVAERLAPIEEQYAVRAASERALAANPVVGKHWNEIVQTINGDPALKELAGYGNHKYADKVMLALGLEHLTKDQAAMLTQRESEITALKGKLSQYEKERVSGLPQSTTRAGTTAGRPAVGEADTVSDAAKSAWLEAGGRLEDFR